MYLVFVLSLFYFLQLVHVADDKRLAFSLPIVFDTSSCLCKDAMEGEKITRARLWGKILGTKQASVAPSRPQFPQQTARRSHHTAGLPRRRVRHLGPQGEAAAPAAAAGTSAGPPRESPRAAPAGEVTFARDEGRGPAGEPRPQKVHPPRPHRVRAG